MTSSSVLAERSSGTSVVKGAANADRGLVHEVGGDQHDAVDQRGDEGRDAFSGLAALLDSAPAAAVAVAVFHLKLLA
jgi:hypothetical protein